MSNTNTETRYCIDCAVELTRENHGFSHWLDRCNRCHGRPELDDRLIEIAHLANFFYRPSDTLDDLRHTVAKLNLRVQELKKVITDPTDSRVEHFWEKLWESLSGDIERDQTWEMFMEAIPGLPDFRSKTFEVEFRFESITITVEAKDEDEAYELAREEFETEYDLGDLASDARFFVTEV